MTITTKKGDKGCTELLSGKKVPKDDARIEACGTLDELSSFLGFSRSLIKEERVKDELERMQKDLFVIGSELAATPLLKRKLKKRIIKADCTRLEKIISRLERSKSFNKCSFHLPGGNLCSSSLDIARTVARRAERRVISLKRKMASLNPFIVVYLNRSSDLLYLFARSFDKR